MPRTSPAALSVDDIGRARHDLIERGTINSVSQCAQGVQFRELKSALLLNSAGGPFADWQRAGVPFAPRRFPTISKQQFQCELELPRGGGREGGRSSARDVGVVGNVAGEDD